MSLVGVVCIFFPRFVSVTHSYPQASCPPAMPGGSKRAWREVACDRPPPARHIQGGQSWRS